MGNHEWNFVTVGQTGIPSNADDRTRIRKAAMQSFRRKERIERVKAFATEQIQKKEPIAQLVALPGNESGSKLSSEASDSIKVEARPTSNFSSPPHKIENDIFVSGRTEWPGISAKLGHPITQPHEDDALMKYLVDYFISMIMPIILPLESESSQGMLRSFWNFISARDLPSSLDTVPRPEFFLDATKKTTIPAAHIKDAHHLINEKMSSEDSAIATEVLELIVLMGMNCHVAGAVEKSQIHLNVLEETVKLKKEKQNIESRSTLNMAILWCNATLARIHSSKPYLISPISPFNQAGRDIMYAQPVPTPKEEVFGLIENLRYLAALKTTLDNNQTATLTKVQNFDAQRHALEEQILTLRQTFRAMPSLGFTDQFLDICCIAASIYMSVCFRNFDHEYSALCALKHDIIAAIENVEVLYGELKAIPDSETPYAEILLWAFFVGGSLALEPSETTWFASRVVEVLPWTPVANWLEAEACFQRMLWVDKMLNPACAALWAEVQERFSLSS